MYGDPKLERKLMQILQVAYPVVVGKEAWLPVIAPLHDMLSDTG
ncbi:hypothetical protein [Xanthomonas sp.]|nr:hypothetical protein [Xanthomonas sp.]